MNLLPVQWGVGDIAILRYCFRTILNTAWKLVVPHNLIAFMIFKSHRLREFAKRLSFGRVVHVRNTCSMISSGQVCPDLTAALATHPPNAAVETVRKASHKHTPQAAFSHVTGEACWLRSVMRPEKPCSTGGSLLVNCV